MLLSKTWQVRHAHCRARLCSGAWRRVGAALFLNLGVCVNSCPTWQAKVLFGPVGSTTVAKRHSYTFLWPNTGRLSLISSLVDCRFTRSLLCCLQMEGSKAGAGNGERCCASPTSLTVWIWPWTYVGANQCVCVWKHEPSLWLDVIFYLVSLHQGETTTASAWISRSARNCFISSAKAGLICGTARPSWKIWYISKADLLNSYFKATLCSFFYLKMIVLEYIFLIHWCVTGRMAPLSLTQCTQTAWYRTIQLVPSRPDRRVLTRWCLAGNQSYVIVLYHRSQACCVTDKVAFSPSMSQKKWLIAVFFFIMPG